MSKILTISIAAYNVEKYIRQTLDSLCNDEVIDDLEIFVVDDNGKDHTLEIAKEYATKYPNSIIPVHKQNGGWGSTVNYSIEHATGKYFRLLDGDDYFDQEGLIKLIEVLKQTEVDVVYTPYRRFDDSTGKTVERFKAGEASPKNSVANINECKDTDFVMHSSSFRTELLKSNGIQIREHCFYTDNEYRTKAMAYVNLAYVMESDVYQYRVGREGQSVDITGLRKHYKENLIVLQELIRFSNSLSSSQNKELTKRNVLSVANYYYNTLVMLNEKQEILEFDSWLKNNASEIYDTNDNMILKLRKSHFSSLGFYSLERRFRAAVSAKVKIIFNH